MADNKTQMQWLYSFKKTKQNLKNKGEPICKLDEIVIHGDAGQKKREIIWER